MRLSIFALSATVLFGFAGAALAADQDFTLRNKTGYQIDDVYLSKHRASEWGSDVMGSDNVLVDGGSTEIQFNDRARGCHWDLKVKYHDDNSTAEWSDINLCEVSTITLHYDRKRDVTRASFD
jgi:hypothetical protein